MVDGLVCALWRPIVSMERPSRGARLSATTTRQTGALRPPTRVSLIATAIVAEQPSGSGLPFSAAALAHHGAEVGHLALLEAAHELAHLTELLDQLVDLLDGG